MVNFFQNFWTLIWGLGGFTLLHLGAWWAEYRQGRYVLKNYPVRYQNQLTSSVSKRPFPFNMRGGRWASPIEDLYKIKEIAKQENDIKLAKSAKKLYWIFQFCWTAFLLILLYELFFH